MHSRKKKQLIRKKKKKKQQALSDDAPASAEPSKKMLSMKLLVDSKAQRVLYAEAGKDVVDFLFSFLTLPVGTVVNLLTVDSMVGCVGNLYGSVEKLDSTHMICRGGAKKALLTPAGGCHEQGGELLLQLPDAAAAPEAEAGHEFFRCGAPYGHSKCYNNVTKSQGAPCPACKNAMQTRMNLVEVEPDDAEDPVKIRKR